MARTRNREARPPSERCTPIGFVGFRLIAWVCVLVAVSATYASPAWARGGKRCTPQEAETVAACNRQSTGTFDIGPWRVRKLTSDYYTGGGVNRGELLATCERDNERTDAAFRGIEHASLMLDCGDIACFACGDSDSGDADALLDAMEEDVRRALDEELRNLYRPRRMGAAGAAGERERTAIGDLFRTFQQVMRTAPSLRRSQEMLASAVMRGVDGAMDELHRALNDVTDLDAVGTVLGAATGAQILDVSGWTRPLVGGVAGPSGFWYPAPLTGATPTYNLGDQRLAPLGEVRFLRRYVPSRASNVPGEHHLVVANGGDGPVQLDLTVDGTPLQVMLAPGDWTIERVPAREAAPVLGYGCYTLDWGASCVNTTLRWSLQGVKPEMLEVALSERVATVKKGFGEVLNVTDPAERLVRTLRTLEDIELTLRLSAPRVGDFTRKGSSDRFDRKEVIEQYSARIDEIRAGVRSQIDRALLVVPATLASTGGAGRWRKELVALQSRLGAPSSCAAGQEWSERMHRCEPGVCEGETYFDQDAKACVAPPAAAVAPPRPAAAVPSRIGTIVNGVDRPPGSPP